MRFALLITTALVTSLGVQVQAADNFSSIVQAGDGNSGKVAQMGTSNLIGTTADAARQTGDRNILVFTQTGSGNAIGIIGSGFEQRSDRNTATITQTANGNVVGQVTQSGIDSATGGVALRRNVLTVTQDSSGESAGNTVGGVTQTRLAASRGLAANVATLVETGGGNNIDAVVQVGYANTASMTQTGNGNALALVEQSGSRNQSLITINGDGNGALPFMAGLLASAPHLSQGHVVQNNDFFGAGLLAANTLSFTISGDDNSFGLWQRGSANRIDGQIGGGDDNQIGVVQDGGSNTADFTVSSNRNVLLIDQSVFDFSLNINNDAAVTIGGGDENLVAVTQGGTSNNAAVAVSGRNNDVLLSQESLLLGNTAEVAIAGTDNALDVTQVGGRNELTVDIWGDNSNRGSFSGVVSSALAASASLAPGEMLQSGVGNTISLTVGSVLQSSNTGNLFAFAQTGNGNTITGTVIGHDNEAVVVQAGYGNLTSFSQIGSGNVIAVLQ